MIADLHMAALIVLGIATAGAIGLAAIFAVDHLHARKRCRDWVEEAYREPLPPLWVNDGRPPEPRRVVVCRSRHDWQDRCGK